MTGRRHTTSLKFKTFMFTTALAATVAVGGGALFSGQAWAQASSAAIAKLSGPDRQKILEDGARKEGKVTIYSSMIVNQLIRPIGDGLEKKYPFIKFEYWRGDTAPILQKVMAERRSNAIVHDVLEYSGTAVMSAIQAGAVESFTSPVLATFDPATYDSKTGFWAGTRISYFGLAYNTKLVADKDVPKTHADLLNPMWKGKMVWGTSDTGRLQFVQNVLIAMGEKDGEAYLKKLSTQNMVQSSASARALVDQVGQGEYPIAVHIYAHHPLISREKGAPLNSSMLEPIDSGLGGIQIAKNGPNPHAAMLLIDFMLSKEGQTIIGNADYFPVNPGVEPGATTRHIVPRYNGMKETVFTPEILFARRDSGLALVEKYFK